VTPARDRLALRLLAAGALVGAAAGVLEACLAVAPAPALPPDAIARVGEHAIPRDELARAVAGLALDRRAPDAERERARAFGRLVDEELLARHALDEGLLTRERAVRDVVVRAMVDAAVADALGRAPSDEELRRFWSENGNADGDGAAREAAFTAARPAVERAFAERERDAALRAYLDALRDGARIEIVPGAGR
jgi:hypothetical protein